MGSNLCVCVCVCPHIHKIIFKGLQPALLGVNMNEF